jgi:hypothetical protein
VNGLVRDLCDLSTLCGQTETKLYKQKGTAMCGAPLHTGLAPPAFTAPCRNQTSVATIQSQSACPLFLSCFRGYPDDPADKPVPGLGMRLQIWMSSA